MGSFSLNMSSQPSPEPEAEQTLLPASSLSAKLFGQISEQERTINHVGDLSRRHPSSCIPICIATVSAAIAALAVAYSFIFSCHNQGFLQCSNFGVSRALSSLQKPAVILISSDGFRYGYQWKIPMPNLDRLRDNGTEAVPGIISVYPTITFPNHYSIATGLYPPWHGIISNQFRDPFSRERFRPGVLDPKWWLGEPLWETVVKNGLIAATYFWPGSDVSKGSWNCTLPYCHHYDSSVPFEDRVDAVLAYFDLPENEKPSFVTLYFEEPDHTGHMVGSDDPHIDVALHRIDEMLGRLLTGLDERGISEDVSIIFLGDHGMVGTCDKKLIYLEDFDPWIHVAADWADTMSTVLALRPPAGIDAKEVYTNITNALKSGKVPNSEFLDVYLKEDLPSRLHYSESDRIQPIIGIVAEGYKVEMKRSSKKECAGTHGYDNEALSMRPIFVAHGPQFARGLKIPSFINVEIYNLICAILGINGAANNGSSMLTDTILLPSM